MLCTLQMIYKSELNGHTVVYEKPEMKQKSSLFEAAYLTIHPNPLHKTLGKESNCLIQLLIIP